MRKQTIRILSLVLAVAMLCSLAACGGNSGTTGHVHTFSMWEVIEEPSSDTNGMQMRKCSTCGFTEYSPILMEGSGNSKPTEPKPTEPAPTEPKPTEPEPTEPVEPISPLSVVRTHAQIQGADGVEPYGNYWYKGTNQIVADLSNAAALAYSLTISEKTTFASLPAGYDPEALLEWGKYPGLNMDILQKYGFTGEGAVIAYVDMPFMPHEQYDDANLHYVNNQDTDEDMHGPMVLSLLAGRDTGTAPDAEIYYYAAVSGYDQQHLADCLYQIIEQNEKLPDDEKIVMVGFSNNIIPERPNSQSLRNAVAACAEEGIMVWFCEEYTTAMFLPMSDKNNPENVMYNPLWCYPVEGQVCVPASGRTGAATMGGSKYIYWGGAGGASWTMPYVLGLYAIVSEIDPTLTQDDLRAMLLETAYENSAGLRIVNPVGFVARALQNVGRGEEGQAMLDEVAAHRKYIYAIMDTAAMTKEDLDAVGSYLASITEATVLVADAAHFANAEELYTALQADAAERGGEVVGVQIFGNADMVPAFQLQYKVQMPTAVDIGEFFLTDLFYGNFNNDPARIVHGYNVMDHFAEGWDVDLVPQWPVARLPLSKGEFSAFFEKYFAFVEDTGLTRLDLVNFSNPIFRQTVHTDDMGVFLDRMNSEFGLLDVPYRLYGNLVGNFPVTTGVLGGFTAENLEKENVAGIVEYIINTHGHQDRIEKCYYVNGEEIRETLINMDTINSVLDDNAYYLDCWTCRNGYGMDENLTTTALNGKCVGMISATTVISSNGANCRANVEEMAQSNFYYFYYQYLKALHEGKTRSQAFHIAQREYAIALIADGANGIRGPANYQFNLSNLLAYHNFGVLEPNAGAMALTEGWGYIAQAGQSVPKKEIQETQQGGSGSMQNNLLLTDGTPVGSTVKINYSVENLLQTGTLEIHSFTYQKLDNGYIRFTMECTAREGMPFSVFNPPNGDIFMFIGGPTTGERQTIVYDISAEDVRSAEGITMRINFSVDDYAVVSFRTAGIV